MPLPPSVPDELLKQLEQVPAPPPAEEPEPPLPGKSPKDRRTPESPPL